jgi:hypothetical protein
MGCLEGSSVPVLYIGRRVPKGVGLRNRKKLQYSRNKSVACS